MLTLLLLLLPVNTNGYAGGGFGTPLACPCASSRKVKYSDCCKPFHDDFTKIPTPSALVRARYSAFALTIPTFIMNTTHPSNEQHYQTDRAGWLQELKGAFNEFELPRCHIVEEKIAEDGLSGTVTFIAHFTSKKGKKQTSFKETAQFKLEPQGWLYLHGDVE